MAIFNFKSIEFSGLYSHVHMYKISALLMWMPTDFSEKLEILLSNNIEEQFW